MLCLVYFGEAKTCPEKTRPHKTRCESYYKCTELPTGNRHVWVPEKCESGLIYEHNLGLCVLPGDDWECNLGEKPKIGPKKSLRNRDKSDIYIVSNGGEDNDITKELDGLELIVDGSLSREEGGSDEEDPFESSGDGRESVELEGFLQSVENREGDGLVDLQAEAKKEEVATPNNTQSNIDPKLTAHLQRLSQLIDGLKKGYTQPDANHPTEMRPDQLNAFLAHFNINNNFQILPFYLTIYTKLVKWIKLQNCQNLIKLCQ